MTKLKPLPSTSTFKSSFFQYMALILLLLMTMVNYQKMSLEKMGTIISIFDYSRLNLKFQEMIYRNRTILISYFLWHILWVIKIILKDRLSFYRFQKKPTHSRGYHFIPSNLLNLEKSTVDGKERLSRLSETAFQELCADVYDEVNCGSFYQSGSNF